MLVNSPLGEAVNQHRGRKNTSASKSWHATTTAMGTCLVLPQAVCGDYNSSTRWFVVFFYYFFLTFALPSLQELEISFTHE